MKEPRPGIGRLVPKNEAKITPPEGGWKESTLYAVGISYSPYNPVHEAFFFTGFLSAKGLPTSYNRIFHPHYEPGEFHSISDVFHMEVIQELYTL